MGTPHLNYIIQTQL